ncbi:MAG: nucleotidyltransferase family protein [Kocuria sp.]|nr:nucleotidyltransferase family protein [Kocuria sp.]
MPLVVRIKLAHGAVDHVLEEAGIRTLHFKGYAATEIFPADRASSDVDVIVDPAQAQRSLEALTAHGWTLVTNYAEGSIFRHAAALWHNHLGYVDVHRWVPGFTAPPDLVFDRLWSKHTSLDIAHWGCPVPARLDHVMLALLHAARDPNRGAHEAQTLWSGLSSAQRDELRSSVKDLGAEVAWFVATGEDLGADRDQAKVWSAIQDGSDRSELLSARLHAARGTRQKARLMGGALILNRSHLQIALGRKPGLLDYAQEYRVRIRSVLRHLRARS